MKRRVRLLLAVSAVLLFGASAVRAQSVVMSYDANNNHRGVLRLIDALADSELEAAVRSGLPLRIRFRTEMWKDGIVDDLLGAEQWTTVVTFDPLGEQYVVRTRAVTGSEKSFSDYKTARAAVEGSYMVSLRPTGSGRFYFTGVVTIETLSLSDLAELERWLKGELQPAVSGDRSIPGALGEGAKRLFMRVLSLPERRFEGRSNRFRLP
jgi:hypothetical protein